MTEKSVVKGELIFTSDEWFSLPLAFRMRWWRETDYGKRRPSDELLGAARTWIAAQESSKSAGTKKTAMSAS